MLCDKPEAVAFDAHEVSRHSFASRRYSSTVLLKANPRPIGMMMRRWPALYTTQSEAGHSSGQLRRPIPPWRRRDLLAPSTAPTHGPSLLRYRANRRPET